MEKIVRVVKELTREWNLQAIMKDPARRLLIVSDRFRSVAERKCKTDEAKEFNFEYVGAGKPTFRVWTKTSTHMLQWRTFSDPSEDRLVLAVFSNGTKEGIHLRLTDFFKDPQEPTEQEVSLICMLYPEVYSTLGHFEEGLLELTIKAEERKKKQRGK